jgi:hypothetical protein
MAMNRIQFQPGLSLPAFLGQFGGEAQCAAALEQARWPEGFRCPRCLAAFAYRFNRRFRLETITLRLLAPPSTGPRPGPWLRAAEASC